MTTPTVVTDRVTARSFADGLEPGTRVPVEIRVSVDRGNDGHWRGW